MFEGWQEEEKKKNKNKKRRRKDGHTKSVSRGVRKGMEQMVRHLLWPVNFLVRLWVTTANLWTREDKDVTMSDERTLSNSSLLFFRPCRRGILLRHQMSIDFSFIRYLELLIADFVADLASESEMPFSWSLWAGRVSVELSWVELSWEEGTRQMKVQCEEEEEKPARGMKERRRKRKRRHKYNRQNNNEGSRRREGGRKTYIGKA